MSQITLSNAETMIADVAPETKPFRIPNPLRAGALSFATTLVVAGGLLAVFNVALNRGMDAYYDKQLAVLASPPTDPAYANANALAQSPDDEPSAQSTATVSAN